LKVCDKHKKEPALIYGSCVGCEIEDLRRQLKLVQSHAKRLLDKNGYVTKWNEGFQAGLKSAKQSWEEGWAYGKEQERLRFEENATFTEEIMKLEELLDHPV